MRGSASHFFFYTLVSAPGYLRKLRYLPICAPNSLKRYCLMAPIARFAVLMLGGLWLAPVVAADRCMHDLTGHDVCAEARQMSNHLAAQLPMQMSRNTVWESVSSFDRTVQGVIALGYDREFLEQTAARANMPLHAIKRGMDVSAAYICGDDRVSAFVQFGGSIHFAYKFADGDVFYEAEVDKC